MAPTTKRLSGLFAQVQHDDEDEEVEVVEFMAVEGSTAADQGDAVFEKETVYSSKRKERHEDEAVLTHAASDLPSTVVTGGEVSMLTPPTKKRRILSQAITALETLIDVIADEEEVLSTRLEYCSNIWRFVREMHSKDVVDFVRQRSSSVVQLIETLLHTGYFPLQQLCFMTIAAILHQLHKRDTEALAAFVVGCKNYLSDADIDILELLPLHETIAWHDPRVARHRIIQINRRTGLCHSFRVTRCWVSLDKKHDLARIKVNKWIDIGSTTTTFYWRDESDVVVVNVPHSCVEDVEIERQNCVLYVWTKSIERLKGVRLLAFSTPEEEFPGLVKALVGVEIEGYREPPIPTAIDFGSPIQTMKTASTLVMGSRSPPSSPEPAKDAVDTSFEPDVTAPDDSEVQARATTDEDSVENDHLDTGFDLDPAKDELEPPTSSDGEVHEEEMDGGHLHVDEVEVQTGQAVAEGSDSLEALHRRVDPKRESKEVSSSEDEGSKIQQSFRRMEKEQERRISGIQTAVKTTKSSVVRRKTRAQEVPRTRNDPDSSDVVFTSASFLLLLVVVLPWVLFASLHSGSDMTSVHQFAHDSLLLITGILRKWASS